jgi:5-methylcytosine-specific restriction enzyme subunit McrC
VGRVRSIDVYDYRLDLSTDEGTDDALANMAEVVAALAGLKIGTSATAASA